MVKKDGVNANQIYYDCSNFSNLIGIDFAFSPNYSINVQLLVHNYYCTHITINQAVALFRSSTLKLLLENKQSALYVFRSNLKRNSTLFLKNEKKISKNKFIHMTPLQFMQLIKLRKSRDRQCVVLYRGTFLVPLSVPSVLF